MVYIVPWDKRGDPLEITNIIKQHKITYTKATPSEYSLWLQYGVGNLQDASDWRFAFGGGETLTNTILRDFRALNLAQLDFYNSYGPTEISISSHKMGVNYRDELPEGRIPCGHSLPNYVTYILDEQLQPLPAGVPGEVFIGGAGVGEGYLNNEELSKTAFIPDPHAKAHPNFAANGWTRMYRTGDIGHLTQDGALVFRNRIAGDTQVKIRGLRIELSDIESNILSEARGTLREAVVTLREGDILVAHVVFAPHDVPQDKDTFLQHLLSRLPIPQYMVPVMAVPLDRLPLSTHSKVDRKAVQALPLPRLAHDAITDDGLELSETMIQLKRVWEDVLGNQFKFNVSPATSFFAIGGNSLLVVRLQARIRAVFHVGVRVVELLDANTLGDMARRIEESAIVETIDWDKETAVPTLDLPGVNGDEKPRPVRSDHKTVLLTGATGFLAKYLVPQLAESSNVSKVYCVAVRDTDSSAARAIAGPKVTLTQGDLSLPRLGLSESAFAMLSAEVDVILHLGAARSFWDSYHTLRPTNVSPTKELVRLAATRKIPIHYVSSAGTVRDPSAEASSAAASAPPTDGTNGYVASKWASERVLERASESLGLPVSIHRHMPSSPERSGQAVDKSIFEQFSQFVDLSKLMPDLGGWQGRIDMIPGEQAARRLVGAVLDDKADRKDGAVYVHHGCETSVDVDEMNKYLLEHKGHAGYDRIAGIRWFGRIKSLGFEYFVASQNITVTRRDVKLESRR